MPFGGSEGERIWQHARRRGFAGNDFSARRGAAPRKFAPAFRRGRPRRGAPLFFLHQGGAWAWPRARSARSAISSERSSPKLRTEEQTHETNRHYRRRPRRTCCSLRAGGAGTQSHPFRTQRLARGQGGAASRRRLPFRHGTDDRDDPVCAAPDLQRSGRAYGGLSRISAARSAVALFLRRRRGARSRAESRRDGADARRVCAGHRLGCGAIATSSPTANASTAFQSVTFSTNRSAVCATCSSGRRRSIRKCSATSSRCAWAAPSRARCANSLPIHASPR